MKHIENNLGVLKVSKDFTIRQRDSKENVGVGINFARASHFFCYISLPFLNGSDVKLPHFTLNGGREQATTKFYLSF